MLKYSVKPSKDIKLMDFPVSGLFVSTDLSYISGYTDTKIGLVDGEQIVIKSPYLIGSETNTINVKTVKRQGKAELYIDLPVKKITKSLKFPIYSDENSNSYILAFNEKVFINGIEGEYVISSVTQNYVEYRGDICYFFSGTPSGYLIDHKFYTASNTDETIRIKTYSYIEDGKLQIGDYTYHADYYKENQEPELRLSKNHTPIQNGDLIGLIEGNPCYIGSVLDYLPNKWERVDKFYIEKKKDPVIDIEEILYGGYKHYITLNDENYYLKDVYGYDDETGEEIYLGYGVMINGTFYEAEVNYGGVLEMTNHDLPFAGSSLYIEEIDEFLEIYDSKISLVNGGRFVFLIFNSVVDVIPGNYIVASSNSPIEIKKIVEEDDDVTGSKKYITFEGKKYEVKNKLHDTVNISEKDFLLTYLNDDFSSASTVIDNDVLYFDIVDGKAILSNKIYYQDKNASSNENIIVKYGIKEEGYQITENSGVTINDKIYPVVEEIEYTNNGDEIIVESVIIEENVKITLEVTDVEGSSTYTAYPLIDDETIDEMDEDMLQREYSNMIVNNFKSFNFTVRKDTFGNKPLTVENGLMKSMESELPYSISDAYLLENKIEIFRVQNFLSFNFPIVNKIATNLTMEDIIKNSFVEYIKGESINTIVDMEKDVYYPVYLDETNNEFKPIQQIRFNLHFRNRDLSNWKIYEDDREFNNQLTPNYNMSNWFITDMSYYKDVVNKASNEAEKTEILKKLHDSSDLIGLINFSTEDVKYQATRIGKSFLRLSFYSTNDPKTQVLLSTSTIFLDENFLYKKYINSKRNADLIFVDVKAMQDAKYEAFIEYQSDVSNDKAEFQVSSTTISNMSEVYADNFFNDDTRLSSRLVVNDKYNTDTSSEGYYMYMFKEYTHKMREATIYMKVDFNHAGIGKTLSFILPRQVSEDNIDGVSKPLYLWNNDDVEILKNGFNLADIYKQIYIPIRIKYDDNSNKYVYYLPSILRENEDLNIDDEIMEFNLFEIKFANESIVKNES